MSGLAERHCTPVASGTPPLNRAEAEDLLDQLSGWSLARQGKGITKTYAFKDFVSAMGFANTITAIAEAQQHHPELLVSWGKVTVSLATDDIGGLSENDFIVAAKIDALNP